ncbi:MAG: aminopeptidase N [Pseudomonadota bacterium]
MRTDVSPPTTRLVDYTPFDFDVESVRLNVSLDPRRTVVTTQLLVQRKTTAKDDAPLVLDGEAIELLAVSVDGRRLSDSEYVLEEKSLTISSLPERCEITIENTCSPETNTALSGLYLSNDMFCTQCEAQGFRRITFYPDRPDVMSVFTVRIEGNKKHSPVLLANGDLINSGDLEGGLHFAEWRDPHKKPAYLFALVGGDLACVEDSFKTCSGREVSLRVFVQDQNRDKCDYTLDSLKRSMKWDEEVFGREYDLDTFMIVAVDHFNAGAMENKGLNIFNSAYVLASPETATDQDYENIESIVAHEYFHNWSGNRVTLRDWFQLCLKEGFTVFRDQEFSADMRDRAVQRIKDVRKLWANQFPEDAGPLSHPPRPSEFQTIDNFYTATVYDKGAEVVRMLKTLLGPTAFRKASDIYFDKNDGKAATIEDFAAAMEEASGRDLTQFRLWWTEAGTPTVHATTQSSKDATEVTLTQSLSPPRVLPLGFGLIDPATGAVLNSGNLLFEKAESTFKIDHVNGEAAGTPLLSLNTCFTAPIVVKQSRTLEDQLALAKADPDPFNRWSVVDGLWRDVALAAAGFRGDLDRAKALDGLTTALDAALNDDSLAPAFVAQLLAAPTASELMQGLENVDPGALVDARTQTRADVAAAISNSLSASMERTQTPGAYDPGAEHAGKRSLKNASLSLLVAAGETTLAVEQASNATNMTDEAAAASILAQTSEPARATVLDAFYEKWKTNTLVVNKWLAWRSVRPDDQALSDIKSLLSHEAFDKDTPNKVRALIGGFAHLNLRNFHAADGSGYDFFVEQLADIDSRNPQLAARLAGAFETWRQLTTDRQSKVKSALTDLSAIEDASSNLKEMAERLLAS